MSVACWLVVAGSAFVLATQVAGVDGTRYVAAAQALTPYLPWFLAPVAVLSSARQHHVVASAAALAGLTVLLLAVPLVFPSSPRPADGAVELRVGVANLLYTNDRTDEIADDLFALDLDVIVFTELTDAHLVRLEAHRLADEFPARIDRSGPLATGIGIWSRFDVAAQTPPDTANRTIDATVGGPDGPIRLLAVHPPTPIYDFDGWRDDLAAIDGWMNDVADDRAQALVVGDFNASFWHPRYRDLIGDGWTDAHVATGKGWSTSWPTDIAIPPYVRLDHAITSSGLAPVDVTDFRVAGSDHAGFVVTVATAR